MNKYLKSTIVFFCFLSILSYFYIEKKSTLTELPLKIKVEQCEMGTVTDIIFAEGNITGEYNVILSAPLSAKIETLYVNEGDKVTKGQLIAKCRIEPTIFEAEQSKADLEAAKAQYIDADARVKRQKKIYDSGVISYEKYLGYEMAFIQAKSNLLKAEKGFEILKIKLRDIDIFAPTSGIVLERHANPGEYATTIITIAAGKKFKAKIDEMQAHLVHKDMPATIFLPSRKKKRFAGSVKRIAPHINTAEHTLETFISFNDSPEEAHPFKLGETGYCRMELKRKSLVIPQSALISFSLDQGMVFIIQDQIAKLRKVTFGTSSNGVTEIIKGVSRGEIVAVSHLQKINDGDRVSHDFF